jgi:hypothetical protein
MELPTIISFAQSVVSGFLLAMRDVIQKKQRLVEENLLCFRLDNIMLVRAFPRISFIPVKASYLRQINHARILSSYTSVASSDNKLFLSDQGKLSQRLLAQPPRQFSLAPEQGLYALLAVIQSLPNSNA